MKVHTKTHFSCKMFFPQGLQSNDTIKKFTSYFLLLVKPISKIAFLGFLISVSRKSRTIIKKKQNVKLKKWRWKFGTSYIIKLKSPVLHNKNFNPSWLIMCTFFLRKFHNDEIQALISPSSSFSLVTTIQVVVYFQSEICGFINIVWHASHYQLNKTMKML